MLQDIDSFIKKLHLKKKVRPCLLSHDARRNRNHVKLLAELIDPVKRVRAALSFSFLFALFFLI